MNKTQLKAMLAEAISAGAISAVPQPIPLPIGNDYKAKVSKLDFEIIDFTTNEGKRLVVSRCNVKCEGKQFNVSFDGSKVDEIVTTKEYPLLISAGLNGKTKAFLQV